MFAGCVSDHYKIDVLSLNTAVVAVTSFQDFTLSIFRCLLEEVQIFYVKVPTIQCKKYAVINKSPAFRILLGKSTEAFTAKYF